MRLFSFSNALIRFFSCWFSSAIFRDSSGLRSPQPISRLPLFALLPAPCTHFHIVYFLTSLFPPFFLFLFYSFEVRVSSFIILHHIACKEDYLHSFVGIFCISTVYCVSYVFCGGISHSSGFEKTYQDSRIQTNGKQYRRFQCR